MRYLSKDEVLKLHQMLLEQSGGSAGIRDEGTLDSALAQPEMSFGGQDLYPSLTDKAAALAYSLIQNHPFVDGNKRVGHAAMEVMLALNGYEIEAGVDEQETLILSVASSELSREAFTQWLVEHVKQLN